jgi:hypothetical protein
VQRIKLRVWNKILFFSQWTFAPLK